MHPRKSVWIKIWNHLCTCSEYHGDFGCGCGFTVPLSCLASCQLICCVCNLTLAMIQHQNTLHACVFLAEQSGPLPLGRLHGYSVTILTDFKGSDLQQRLVAPILCYFQSIGLCSHFRHQNRHNIGGGSSQRNVHKCKTGSQSQTVHDLAFRCGISRATTAL